MPRSQTPPFPTTNTPAITQAAPTAVVVVTPIHETRAGWKRSKRVDQIYAAPDFENSPSNLGYSGVNIVGAPTYTHSFTMDGIPLPTTNRVRLWGQGG